MPLLNNWWCSSVDYVQQRLQPLALAGQSAKTGVEARISALKQGILDHPAVQASWEAAGKPLHQRYLEPLSEADLWLLKRSWGAAALAAAVCWLWFVSAFVPIMMVNGLVLGAVCRIAGRRAELRLNQQAGEQVQTLCNDLQRNAIDWPSIEERIKKLKKSPFDYLEERIKPIEAQLNALRNSSDPSSQPQKTKEATEALLGLLIYLDYRGGDAAPTPGTTN